jgi:hypothetical protein
MLRPRMRHLCASPRRIDLLSTLQGPRPSSRGSTPPGGLGERPRAARRRRAIARAPLPNPSLRAISPLARPRSGTRPRTIPTRQSALGCSTASSSPESPVAVRHESAAPAPAVLPLGVRSRMSWSCHDRKLSHRRYPSPAMAKGTFPTGSAPSGGVRLRSGPRIAHLEA